MLHRTGIPRVIPPVVGRNFDITRNAEIIELHEAVEKKGRCFVERVLYPLGGS